MKPLLCIHHHPCIDGFGAAWVVRRFCIGNKIPVEFHPGVYQNPPPDVTDRHVLLVDFSYKADVLAEMHHQSYSMLVLDHHKTAQDDLSMLPIAPDVATVADRWANELHYPANAIFDMDRSGAGLTWDYFNPGVPRLPLIDHLEDRDLWRWAIPGSREVNANVFSFPYDFVIWDYLMSEDIDYLMQEGKAIERKHHKDIAELVEIVTRPMRFKIPVGEMARLGLLGFPDVGVVPVANVPYTLTSDAGHALCERNFQGKRLPRDTANSDINPVKYRHAFAACYWDTPEGRVFSLRSRDDGADVGEIAKLYGGGGHPHASGFRVPYSDLAQFEP